VLEGRQKNPGRRRSECFNLGLERYGKKPIDRIDKDEQRHKKQKGNEGQDEQFFSPGKMHYFIAPVFRPYHPMLSTIVEMMIIIITAMVDA